MVNDHVTCIFLSGHWQLFIKMLTKKDRRQSGYYTPRATVPVKALIKDDLFINPIYDDWLDYRDGMRDCFGEYKKIKKLDPGYEKYNDTLYDKRIKMNNKQKR